MKRRKVLRDWAGRAGVLLCLGARLARAGEADVVINEIMYHPPNEQEELQFIELFNRGGAAVDVSGWRFTKGLKFALPENTTLAPGGYLVVCRNLEAFKEHYGRGIAACGDFSGRLKQGGERIELVNARRQVVDWARFGDRDPWPVAPDGLGPSLERICPAAPGRLWANWASSKLPPFEKAAGTPGRRNDSFCTNVPPAVSGVEWSAPQPDKPVTVTAVVSDEDGVKAVKLLWQVAREGSAGAETAAPMERVSGDEKEGTWRASIPAQAQGALVRFRLKALDGAGLERVQPSTNEPCPTFSYGTFVNTNRAEIPFAYVLRLRAPQPEVPLALRGTRLAQMVNSALRGNGAFVYAPAGSREVLTFDHVRFQERGGGFKVHLPKGHNLRGMTALNIIFEGPPRWVLAEHLSYELYRLAGTPAPHSEHVRVWQGGRLAGYMLLVEQPNKGFLRRHGRDDSGNLYKLIWQGSGIAGQHEKKTHPTSGHDDLVQVIEGLRRSSGAAQWDFIQRNINVEVFANYYAVNMCIENWDGFHNNYFAYHDTGGTGKWEVYPWDEDKTWGDYDGASPRYDWYEMPLTMGMRGDRSPRLDPRSKANNRWGGFGGLTWWRPPGWFSGPLLANAEFRQRFLARLRELCATSFTVEKFGPVIDGLEKQLAPEVALRARALRQSPQDAEREFRADMRSFRNQLLNRRRFILAELEKAGR